MAERGNTIAKVKTAEGVARDNYEKLLQVQPEVRKLELSDDSLFERNQELRKYRRLSDFVVEGLKH